MNSTNNGGVINVPVLSVGALHVNGQRLKDMILGLQSEITFNQEQITEINAFLARLDLQITDPNILTLTNENRNQVLKALIDALNTKTNYLDTTALTQSWVLTDTNKNSTLKTSIDALNTKTNLLDTTALTLPWVLTDTSRNAILKTRIDGNDTSLGTLTTKTQYLSSSTGNNSTNPKIKSVFEVHVEDRDETQIHLQSSFLNFVSINTIYRSFKN